MLITDQIKLFMESPLRGPNLPEFGVRFPDASHLYTPSLLELARTAASEAGLSLREGVYMYFPALSMKLPPRYGSPGSWGLTRWACPPAPEVIVAGHCSD